MGILLLEGPFWLLQLWMNATFDPSLTTSQTYHHVEGHMDWPIEGRRLALLTPAEKGLSTQESFIEYYMMFSKRYNFTEHMTRFSNMRHGPVWFKR